MTAKTLAEMIGEQLDQADDLPVNNAYRLEVSSPGIERPLKKPKDFMRFKDELVEVKLYKAIDGMKSIIGRLETATRKAISPW